MEQLIQVLDQNTANQIAAGEVVEKPASVVKELIENALDAQAQAIEITIYDGGIDYIRVVDNGSGMSEANAKLAVLRHATSKIISADDLLKIHTLGFRGEALPSIASVAKFTLLTRLETEDFATSITIQGGSELECVATGGSVGTTVIVEDLFFNVPARRKFLKTTSTEGRYVNDIVSKIALSRPDVHFKLVNNDKEVLNTPGNGNVLDTISALYGKKVTEQLLPVSYSDHQIEVQGYIGKPTLLKGTRQWQTLFVNGRSISNRMLAKAIDHAYQSQIPKIGFPFAVLNLEVDTASIDINVHPQKSEIKFSDDGAVYRVVYHALTEALTKPLSAESVLQLLEDSPLQEVTNTKASSTTTIYQPSYPPVQESIWKTPLAQASSMRNEHSLSVVLEATTQPLQTEKLGPECTEEGASAVPSPPALDLHATDNGVDRIWPLGQIDKVFIVAQSEDALYLIDQHAAHERILYDKLVKTHDKIPAQQFLVPLYLDATPHEITLIEEHRQEFSQLGVEIEAAGADLLRISSLPADIKDEEAASFVAEISKMLVEMKEISPSDLRQNVLHYAACHGAIKAGEVLTLRQMRTLILDLCNTEHPFTCPHGRPCMVEITSAELYKMFKRT
ncbi:MAG: DNA mismatch repair endonuclease MutL [Acidaminococcaceae bacterium]